MLLIVGHRSAFRIRVLALRSKEKSTGEYNRFKYTSIRVLYFFLFFFFRIDLFPFFFFYRVLDISILFLSFFLLFPLRGVLIFFPSSAFFFFLSLFFLHQTLHALMLARFRVPWLFLALMGDWGTIGGVYCVGEYYSK